MFLGRMVGKSQEKMAQDLSQLGGGEGRSLLCGREGCINVRERMMERDGCQDGPG